MLPQRAERVESSMRKNFGSKPVCYPMPVYIIATYNQDGTPNAMNAAWGMVSEVEQFTVRIHAGHKTAENILARKAFTVSMATLPYMKACDYVGIVSGHKVPDKFARAGFNATRSEFVDAPIIDELPMALECSLLSFDRDTNSFVAKIVNVSAEESVLGENGKVDPLKLQPITYDPVNHNYMVLGENVGLAYRVGQELK